MKVEALSQVDKSSARELWRMYQTHKHYQTEADAEIAAIYKRIAQGHTVIRALESIRVAGLDEKLMPRLAICRANEERCFFSRYHNECSFASKAWPRSNDSRNIIKMPWPGLNAQHRNGAASVPIIPVHLRPRRGLANYHILWEAEWDQTYPADPYLLRRIGHGDAWLVVAAWDLTDVERAVMSQRMRN